MESAKLNQHQDNGGKTALSTENSNLGGQDKGQQQQSYLTKEANTHKPHEISKELEDKIEQLVSDNRSNKQKICDLELKNTALDQYSRHNNVEIGGIPEGIESNKLEKLVIDVL